MKKDKIHEVILAEYQNKADEVIRQMLAILAKAEKEADIRKYETTYKSLKNIVHS